MKNIILTIALISFTLSVSAQVTDKSEFKKSSPGFYDKVIMRDIVGDDNFSIPDYSNDFNFAMDFGLNIYPVQISKYKTTVVIDKISI